MIKCWLSAVKVLDIRVRTKKYKEGESMLFICYPKCSTCKKAKKWLDEHHLNYTERHIVEEKPSYDELKRMGF